MRKNFVLTTLLFLLINILGIANENIPTVNTNINSMNPVYDETLKEYKIQFENTEKFYNYIDKTIKEKGIATTYTKLENHNLVASDENNNIIFTEQLPENLLKTTTYFESKQVYQLKNGKMLVNIDYTLETNGEKTRTISEVLFKESIKGKNIFEILDIMGDLNISSEKTFSKIENYNSKLYDINNEKLIFSITYKNRKLESESEVDGTFVKMTYTFDDNNFNKGTINLYMDNNLFATVRAINSLQDGEMKMFYPNGKIMATSTFKNGKLNGVSKMYYNDGNIMMISNFKDDELNDETILYDENGKVMMKQLYKDGKEIRK